MNDWTSMASARGALVVDPDLAFAAQVSELLQAKGYRVLGTFAHPRDALEQPALMARSDLLLSEAMFGHDTCLALLRAYRERAGGGLCLVTSSASLPVAVAGGIREWADGCLAKPLRRNALQLALAQADDPGAACRRLARRMVGRVGLQELQDELRRNMLQEALRRTRDSRRAAAGLLGIDRRCVQRMVGKYAEHDREWVVG